MTAYLLSMEATRLARPISPSWPASFAAPTTVCRRRRSRNGSKPSAPSSSCPHHQNLFDHWPTTNGGLRRTKRSWRSLRMRRSKWRPGRTARAGGKMARNRAAKCSRGASGAAAAAAKDRPLRRPSKSWRRDGQPPTRGNADAWTVSTTPSRNCARSCPHSAAIANCPNSKHSRWPKLTSTRSTNWSSITDPLGWRRGLQTAHCL